MHITRLKLTNWRNFTSVDLNLAKRVFIVGPNAAGKSNFLDVFRFLHDIAKPGGSLSLALNSRGGLRKIRCLSARNKPKVSIEISFTDEKQKGDSDVWVYRLVLEQESHGNHREFVSEEFISKNDAVIKHLSKESERDVEVLTQTLLQQTHMNRNFKPIVDFFADTTYFHLVPQVIKDPAYFVGEYLSVEDVYGKRFLERIATADKNHRRAWLRRIASVLRLAVPHLTDISLDRDPNTGVPHFTVMHENWRSKGAKQGERELSDGTLRLIALLWFMMDGKHLLLLEEPEISLHSAIVQQLPSLILKSQKYRDRQVFLTTHSYELLTDSGISLEEIVMLLPSKEGTTAVLASKRTDAKKLLSAAFSPAEIVIATTQPHDVHKISELQLNLL